MKVILHTILLSLILSFINSVNHLTFKLERGDDICLSEYFSDKTLVIYSINSQYNMEVKITDPNDIAKFQKVKLEF